MKEVPVLRVGCPMWAHRPWVGRWYPAGTKSGTELPLYTQLCNAVEGNTTFYAEPSEAAVKRWLAQTPVDFRFAFKLPRTVTHDRRLQDVAGPVRSFLDRIEPLGERIGPVQVQLPPAFGPVAVEVLLAFMRRLPLDWSWAIELRHPGWFDGSDAHRRVDELAIERGIGRVVLDTRPLYAAAARTEAAVEERGNKPSLPIVLDAAGPHPIIRVIGQDSPEGSLEGLVAWVPQVVEWLAEGREPFVFAHQPENLDSPGLARAFHDAVRAEVPALRPLPDVPAADPAQPSMF